MSNAKNGPTWKTRDGRVLPIADMGDDHLANTIRMLRRKGFIGRSTLEAYMTSGPSGDMASMAFEQEQREVFSRPVSEALDHLEAEARKRGLEVTRAASK